MVCWKEEEETPQISLSLPLHTHSNKVTNFNVRKEVSPDTNSAATLSLDFQPPELRENFSVVKATQSVVLCYGSLSRVIILPVS